MSKASKISRTDRMQDQQPKKPAPVRRGLRSVGAPQVAVAVPVAVGGLFLVAEVIELVPKAIEPVPKAVERFSPTPRVTEIPEIPGVDVPVEPPSGVRPSRSSDPARAVESANERLTAGDPGWFRRKRLQTLLGAGIDRVIIIAPPEWVGGAELDELARALAAPPSPGRRFRVTKVDHLAFRVEVLDENTGTTHVIDLRKGAAGAAVVCVAADLSGWTDQMCLPDGSAPDPAFQTSPPASEEVLIEALAGTLRYSLVHGERTATGIIAAL